MMCTPARTLVTARESDVCMGRFKHAYELLNIHPWIKYPSFNIRIWFVCNFKGYFWNPTQNIASIHLDICFLHNSHIKELLHWRAHTRLWDETGSMWCRCRASSLSAHIGPYSVKWKLPFREELLTKQQLLNQWTTDRVEVMYPSGKCREIWQKNLEGQLLLPGPLFTKRTDVLQQDLVESRSCDIRV